MPSEELAHSIARHLRDIVSIVDADGTIRYVNHATETALGSSPDDAPGQDMTAWVHPEDLPEVRERQRWLFSEPGRSSTSTSRIRRADGGWTRMSTHGINLLHDPVVRGVLFVSRDIEQYSRDQAALEQSLRAQRMVADLGLRALVSGDLEGLLREALEQVTTLLRVTWVALHELLDHDGMVLRRMIGPTSLPPGTPWPATRRSQVSLTLERRRPTSLRELRAEPGFEQAPESSALGVVDALCVLLEGPDGPRGALTILTATPREFSAGEEQQLQAVANVLAGALLRDRRERTAVERALHDELTGLPTRSLLHDRLDQALRRSEREALPVALLLIDLDGFKQVNDTLGHAAGDAVLAELGGRLRDCIRAGDTVARYGGDEFVVLCEQSATHVAVGQVAARIRRACLAPFTVPGGTTAGLSASIGIGWSTDVGTEPGTLLTAADAAMYRDKRSRPRLDDQPDGVAPLAGELLDPVGDLLQGQQGADRA